MTSGPGRVEFALTNGCIRPWRVEDQESLARHANNRKIWRNLRDTFPHPYTEGDAREYIARHAAAPDVSNLAIEVDGEAAGGIGLRVGAEGDAELGYWLGEAHWGRGIMTDAVTAITAYGLETLGLRRIHADVFEWNAASMRGLEKAGYRLEARHENAIVKDGETVDELVYVRGTLD